MGSTYKSKLENVGYIPQTSYEGVNAATRNAVALFNKASDNAMRMGQNLVKMGEDRAADARRMALQKEREAAAKRLQKGRGGGGGGGKKKAEPVSDADFIEAMAKRLGAAKPPVVIMNPTKKELEVPLNNRLTEEMYDNVPYNENKDKTTQATRDAEAIIGTTKNAEPPVTDKFTPFLPKQEEDTQQEQKPQLADKFTPSQEKQAAPQNTFNNQQEYDITKGRDTSHPLSNYLKKREEEFRTEFGDGSPETIKKKIQEEANKNGQVVFFVNNEKERKIVTATAKKDYFRNKKDQDILRVTAAYRKLFGIKKSIPKSVLNALTSKTQAQYEAAKEEEKRILSWAKNDETETKTLARTRADETQKAIRSLNAADAAKKGKCGEITDPVTRLECVQKSEKLAEKENKKENKKSFKSKLVTSKILQDYIGPLMYDSGPMKDWSGKTKDLYNTLAPLLIGKSTTTMRKAIGKLNFSKPAIAGTSTVNGNAWWFSNDDLDEMKTKVGNYIKDSKADYKNKMAAKANKK